LMSPNPSRTLQALRTIRNNLSHRSVPRALRFGRHKPPRAHIRPTIGTVSQSSRVKAVIEKQPRYLICTSTAVSGNACLAFRGKQATAGGYPDPYKKLQCKDSNHETGRSLCEVAGSVAKNGSRTLAYRVLLGGMLRCDCSATSRSLSGGEMKSSGSLP
jgi:hypothetical protein